SSLLNHTTTPKLHTLSLHDALPIYRRTINIPSLKGLLRIAGKTQAGASAMKKMSDSLQTEAASQVSRRWFIEQCGVGLGAIALGDRKSTRLNSSHSQISYAVFCLKK